MGLNNYNQKPRLSRRPTKSTGGIWWPSHDASNGDGVRRRGWRGPMIQDTPWEAPAEPRGVNQQEQEMGLETAHSYFFSATKLDQGSLKGWTCMSVVKHHTVAVDAHSHFIICLRQVWVWTAGAGVGYGWCQKCQPSSLVSPTEVACGTTVSLAITESAELYAWGLGTNGQLGQGNEEDLTVPTRIMSQQLENRRGDPCVCGWAANCPHCLTEKINTREIMWEIEVCLHTHRQGHFWT